MSDTFYVGRVLSSVMTLGIIDKFELFKFMSAFSELELISIIQINF